MINASYNRNDTRVEFPSRERQTSREVVGRAALREGTSVIGARDQRWYDAVREKIGGRDDARPLGLVTLLRGCRADLSWVVGLQPLFDGPGHRLSPRRISKGSQRRGCPAALWGYGQTSTALPVRDRTQRETTSDGKDRDGTVRAEVAARGPGGKPLVEVRAGGAVWIVTYMAVIHEKPGMANALAVLSPPGPPTAKKSPPGRRCQAMSAVGPNYKRRQP